MNPQTAADELNALIALFNEGRLSQCESALEAWCAAHCVESAGPECHNLIYTAAEISKILKRRDLNGSLQVCAYDRETDQAVRRACNEILTQLNAGDADGGKMALADHLRRQWPSGQLLPGLEDVFAVYRRNVISMNLDDLLPILDRAIFRNNVFMHDRVPFRGVIALMIPTAPVVQLFADGDCGICDSLTRTGAFEPTSLDVWCGLATQANDVLDIGANVGPFALAAAAVNSTARVRAFEPNPEVHLRLQKNVEINGLKNIQVRSEAVSDTDGEASFRFPACERLGYLGRVGSLDDPRDNFQEITVETLALDTLCDDITRGRVLVKIDTEGAEDRAIRGMTELIDRVSPDIIVESYEAEFAKQMNETMGPRGYRFYRIIEGAHELVQVSEFRPAQPDSSHDYNCLVTARSPQNLRDLLPSHCRIL